MKKSPPAPDTNAQAPRPSKVSDEDTKIPAMGSPPPAPSSTATSFDRATAATDQEYRSGLLPGSDDLSPAGDWREDSSHEGEASLPDDEQIEESAQRGREEHMLEEADIGDEDNPPAVDGPLREQDLPGEDDFPLPDDNDQHE